jgi:hypothetical protein
MNRELHEVKRDNQVCRSIFEASPIPDSARAKMIETGRGKLIASLTEDELNTTVISQINTLHNRLYTQTTSFSPLKQW